VEGFLYNLPRFAVLLAFCVLYRLYNNTGIIVFLFLFVESSSSFSRVFAAFLLYTIYK
jgi:phosphatidylglycerophosphate synthase